MDKILVTGAEGWLGKELVRYLVNKGKKVRCLVFEGIDLSKETLIELKGAKHQNNDVEIIKADVTKPSTLNNICEGVDAVIHCAGIIHPKLFGVKDFYRINSSGTLNILKSSEKAGINKFIYISSNSATGVNKKRSILMNENTKEKPYTPYGKSKYQAEQYVKDYGRKFATVIIRPCWFYGPNQPERMTKLMNMIKSGRPLLFGDGKNLRSMSYISNLVQGIYLALENDAANGKTYWIADNRPYSTTEIYEEIAKQLGVKLNPKFIPKIASRICEMIDIVLGRFGIYEINFHVAGEMTRDIACDTSKAERELGYKPEINLEEGMKRSIEWAKNNNLI